MKVSILLAIAPPCLVTAHWKSRAAMSCSRMLVHLRRSRQGRGTMSLCCKINRSLQKTSLDHKKNMLLSSDRCLNDFKLWGCKTNPTQLRGLLRSHLCETVPCSRARRPAPSCRWATHTLWPREGCWSAASSGSLPAGRRRSAGQRWRSAAPPR